MPARTTITVNDRETTPVAHAFVPSGTETENGSAVFVEKGSLPIGEPKLTIRWSDKGPRSVARITYAEPVLVTEVVNGVSVPTVIDTNLVDANFRFSKKVTEQVRNNFVGKFYNLLSASQTVVHGTVVKGEGIW